jgi:formylmethanofuran dehydrogenase subunit E
MGKNKNLKCAFCGKEISKKEATYVEGRPYCDDCYTEAEAMADVDDGWDDEDEDDDD